MSKPAVGPFDSRSSIKRSNSSKAAAAVGTQRTDSLTRRPAAAAAAAASSSSRKAAENEFDLSRELNTAITESDKALIVQAKKLNDVAGTLLFVLSVKWQWP